MAEVTGTTITIEAQSTDFLRSGWTDQTVTHTPIGGGPAIQPVIGQGVGVSTPASFTPTGMDGLPSLQALYNVSNYEAETDALYDRTLCIAIAATASGPNMVRGGEARFGFAVADAAVQVGLNRFREIWGALVAWAQITVQSVERYNSVCRAYDAQRLSAAEQIVMAQHANAQSSGIYLSQVNAYNQAMIQAYTAARHYGQTRMYSLENLNGYGNQGGMVTGFGMNSYR